MLYLFYTFTHLSCLVADDLDGSGLQLEKISHFFQVVPVYFRKVTRK